MSRRILRLSLPPSTASRIALAAFATLLLGACAGEGPFVEPFEDAQQRDSLHTSNVVHVCYSDDKADPLQVALVAEDACEKIGRHAIFSEVTREQCRWTAGNMAVFSCVGPHGETTPVLKANSQLK